MALDGTYDGLKASVADWLNRADLTAQIPDFVALAEARFNRVIRHNAMLQRDTTTASSDYVELPEDWLEHVTVTVANSNTSEPLQYVTNDEYFRQRRLTRAGGEVRMYTIQDRNLLLLPAFSSGSVPLELVYYGKIPALGPTNSSNWLLSRAPDIYLYGSLLAAEAYLQNDERLPIWAGQFDNILAELAAESERAKRAQGSIVARKRTFG